MANQSPEELGLCCCPLHREPLNPPRAGGESAVLASSRFISRVDTVRGSARCRGLGKCHHLLTQPHALSGP